MPQCHKKEKNKKEQTKIITTYTMHTYRTNSEHSYTSLMKLSN